ncbi:MAG: AzlD domain-containing protein [Lachnospiraceae bacterium]|nr:AzlD domain-containing protein [Lachnospiraceae bacterium]
MTGYILSAILVSAGITFALRALPFWLFRGERRMPEWMNRLGGILPSAIMAVLIVYCLRSARSDFMGSGIPGIVALLVVAGSYKWKHNTFVSMIAGTVVYMLLIRIVGGSM